MKAIVLGSTGLVGGCLVNQLLNLDSIKEVVVFNRHSLGFEHSKLNEQIVDFDKINELNLEADFMFCCLGTTIKKAASKQGFRKVDYDLPYEFADLFSKTHHQGLAVISAIGASSNSSFFYNQVKGELEDSLKALPLNKLVIVRPSLLLGEREENRLAEDIGQKLSPFLNFILPKKYRPVNAQLVARTMIDLCIEGKTDADIDHEIIS
ncbi:MAG: hypothetical protein KC478_15530 [Bacteriovoracaceae bacterium]|nr:hypothetical protein [Bacteriovoracaceae bacterium]